MDVVVFGLGFVLGGAAAFLALHFAARVHATVAAAAATAAADVSQAAAAVAAKV